MNKPASNAIAIGVMAVIVLSIMIGSHLPAIKKAEGVVVTKTGGTWGFYVAAKSDLFPEGGATFPVSKDKFGAIDEGDVVCIGYISFWRWFDRVGRCP